VYVVAKATHRTEVSVTAEDDLAEVTWFTLTQIDHLIACCLGCKQPRGSTSPCRPRRADVGRVRAYPVTLLKG